MGSPSVPCADGGISRATAGGGDGAVVARDGSEVVGGNDRGVRLLQTKRGCCWRIGWWREVVGVARGSSSRSTSHSGVDGSGCAWARLISCSCEGVRVEEMNVGSQVTSKFVRLSSL